MNVQSALGQLFDGKDLSREDTKRVFAEVMSGNATPAQIGALLAALRVKGETPEEVAGAAETMRALSLKVEVSAPNLVDTCGTGGSGLSTPNTSTVSVSPVGLHVAKCSSLRVGSTSSM